jgi:ADP-heptose:LPS heptosyltransferase
VVLATPTVVPRAHTLARALAPGRIVGFTEDMLRQVAGRHEVERVFALAAQLDIDGPIPALKVLPDPALVDTARLSNPQHAVQISTRRPAQQWPADRFVELVQRLDALGIGSMLLWSPGPSEHPRHPGDDEKAAEISGRLAAAKSFVAYRTGSLAELIGALAACDAVVTSDGGAMHLAAALQKPVVCFFGDVAPEQWRPWGVPHRVLRPQSRKATDITVDETLAALRELTGQPSKNL